MERNTMSVSPPAGHGTINLTGRAGDWALAGAITISAANNIAATKRRRFLIPNALS
jgi:hypothetical protein